jgi:histone-binding protein RBBP4
MNRDKVVDFQWNILDPWTVVSVSADCEKTGGGGTLQVRRLPFSPLTF